MHWQKVQLPPFVPAMWRSSGFVDIAAKFFNRSIPIPWMISLANRRFTATPSNSLHYSLTWSTDGLINEYGNPCHAIENGKEVTVAPLAGLGNSQN